jgi:hypothetical protein
MEYLVRGFFSTILFIACGILVPLRAVSADEVPFQLRDGLIWVDVSAANSPGPLHFLLDSGAEVSTINLRTIRSLGVKLGPPVPVNGVQTSGSGFWPQRVRAKMAGVALPRNMLAVDLSALADACSMPVDGLIGADFFRDRVVQIDFQKHVVRLLDASEAKAVGSDSLPLELRRCGMRVPVSVNHHQAQWLRVDTGCAAALHWVTTSVDPKLCRKQMAIGLTKFSLPTASVNVRLGSENFENVAADLHAKEIFAGEAGLLGNGLLARFSQVTIDARASRLILTR